MLRPKQMWAIPSWVDPILETNKVGTFILTSQLQDLDKAEEGRPKAKYDQLWRGQRQPSWGNPILETHKI